MVALPGTSTRMAAGRRLTGMAPSAGRFLGRRVGGVVGDMLFLGADLSTLCDAKEQTPLRFRSWLLESV
jgi:hypothetical protein